jgi:hypothetical protein
MSVVDHMTSRLPAGPEPQAAPTAVMPTQSADERQSILQLRPMGVAGHRAVPVLLSSSRCPAQVRSDYLQPEISLSYERHAVDSNSGTFTAEVSLLNRARHTAHQPFVCLPILGLQLSPATGWSMRDVSSIRRLRRFGPDRDELLASQASVHCCNISLLFNAASGGRVEYETGNWHGLNGLPDLRLTCVVGAGNYPSERLPLVVPADTIKSLITELIVMNDIPGSPIADQD